MNRSESVNELSTALAKAQLEMKAAPKSAINPHFKSKYAPLNEVIDVAKTLAKHGLSFVQPARMDEQGQVVVETVLLHASGQWLSESLSLRPQQNTPQGVGSCITYGRRFGLASMVGIAADEDDDGNAASAGTGNGQSKPALPTADQGDEYLRLKKLLVDSKTAPQRSEATAAIRKSHAEGLITDLHRAELLKVFAALPVPEVEAKA